MLNRIFSAVALVSLVVGCASMGPDFSMADVDALQPGITTFDDAQKKLGKPNATSYGANGAISAVWTRSEANFLGAASARTVVIVFDGAGKMIRIASRAENKMN